MVAPVDGAV